MDALLSLPLLGYFFMPSLGTYSMSLNLAFFYLTWTTLVLSQAPLKVEVIGTIGIRLLFFLIPSTIFLVFDTLLPSLAVGIKKQGSSALPTRTGGLEGSKRGGGRTKWYQVIGLSLLNIFLGVAVQAGVEVLFMNIFQNRSALKIITSLPMPWSIAKEMARALLLREVLQYYIHRYIHSPSAPKYLSDSHDTYYHSIKSPYSFVAHYDHPLPYLLWRFLPLYVPAILFQTHLLIYLLLLALISLEEALTLSGYTIVPGIMLGGFARRQDLHCQSSGKGNFAPWGIMDWIHGTSIGANVMDDVRDEAEKHNVADRSGKAWENAKESGKSGVRAWNSRKRSSRKS